jgi:hypothetical protein
LREPNLPLARKDTHALFALEFQSFLAVGARFLVASSYRFTIAVLDRPDQRRASRAQMPIFRCKEATSSIPLSSTRKSLESVLISDLGQYLDIAVG